MEARRHWNIFKVVKKKSANQEFYVKQKHPSRMMVNRYILQRMKTKTSFSQLVIERIHHQEIDTKENTKEYSLGKLKLDGSL